MKKTDLAWLAGFFEGEGWVWINPTHQDKKRFYFQPLLGIGQLNRRPLDWVCRNFGGKVSPKYRKRYGRRYIYCWHWSRTGRAGILRFLHAVLPYCRIKTKPIRLALELTETLMTSHSTRRDSRYRRRQKILYGRWRKAFDKYRPLKRV